MGVAARRITKLVVVAGIATAVVMAVILTALPAQAADTGASEAALIERPSPRFMDPDGHRTAAGALLGG